MVVPPVATPVTIPLDEQTVALDVLLLLQVPPDVALDSVVVVPRHTKVLPVMDVTAAFTETAFME